MEQQFLDEGWNTPLKRFEQVHNHLYANDGLSEHQVLDEIVKLLFLKYLDEQQDARLFRLGKGETSGSASFHDRIALLLAKAKQEFRFCFDKHDALKLSGDSLFFVVGKLQGFDFSKSGRDANGLAFQKFLSAHAKGGRGQFFTPDPVIDYCVEIIKPQQGERIIDPACGTGGFLFSSFNYIKKTCAGLDMNRYVRDSIFGIEINKKISHMAKMKFLLEANASPNIICENALKPLADMRFGATQNVSGFYDIVLTNPPFGAQGRICSRELLSNYDLGYKWHRHKSGYCKSSMLLKGQVPDVLFIEQCINLLKPGGRLGIVLPNGHFENVSMEYLREYIKEKAFVTNVVLLPAETFIPYGTGVKCSLLFLRKKAANGAGNGKVFFSRIAKLGYAGNKNGTPVYKKDGNGSPVLDEDYTESIQAHDRFIQKSSVVSGKHFCIDADELNNRFDYNYYLPENRLLISTLKKSRAAKLGDIASIVKVKSVGALNCAAVEYVELSDVHATSYEIINSTTLRIDELPSRASYQIKTGDIITAVAGNSIGTCKHVTAYVSEEYNNAICTNGFRVLRGCEINEYYLLHYFQTELFLKQILMYRTGAAIPAISDADFSNLLIYLPAQKVMDDIVSRVKASFKLREDAKKELASLKTNMNMEYLKSAGARRDSA